MKTSLAKAIALAATLGAAASAQAAIDLNHDGLGQVLLYPLYTVENGNDTAISVTNTTNEYKVIKVRFREALNSQDVLDFHVFLSPEDVWNAVIVADGTDGARLVTSDTSVVVPAIPAGGAPLSRLAYTGGSVETQQRGADATAAAKQSLKRTRLGYAEIIELGVLDPAYQLTKANGSKVTVANAVKHVNGKPRDAQAVIDNYLYGDWKDGSSASDFIKGFKNASDNPVLGGLYGVGTISNVAAGQQIGYDATALDNFIAERTVGSVTDVVNLHTETGYSYPDLNGLPGGIGATKQANISVAGLGTTYTFSKTIDAVSALLQKQALHNEFSVEAAVAAGTDWVVTFPTKHYYVWDSQWSATNTAVTPTAADVAPFEVSSLWKKATGTAPVKITLGYLDREENKVTTPNSIDFSPRPVTPTNDFFLDYEANVVTFNKSNVLVSEDTIGRYSVNVNFDSGWATIGLVNNATQNAVTATAPAQAFVGLPAIGFSTIKVANGNLNGVLSNYAAAWQHKATK